MSGLTVTGNLAVDTNTLFVNASTNRVGVLTTSPNEALEVAGNCRLSSGGATRTLHMGSHSAGIEYNVNGTTFIQGRTDAYPLAFKTQSAERMRITGGGDVSIGTTVSNERLNIHTASSLKAQMQFTNTTTGTAAGDGLVFGITGGEEAIIWNQENTDMAFATNNTEAMRIDSSGKVGINETSPLAKFHVKVADSGGSAYGHCAAVFEDSDHTYIDIMSGTTGSGGINFGDSGGSQRGVVEYDHNSDFMRLTVAGGERMRIDSSGRLLINGTDANAVHTNADDVIIGNTSASLMGLSIVTSTSGYATLQFSDGGGSKNQGQIAYNHADNSLAFTTDSSVRMKVDSSGNVGIGETAPANLLHVKVSDTGVNPHTSAQIVLERYGTNYLQFFNF